MSDDKLITPELFSERVLLRSQETKESILESLAALTQELDLEEEVVKKLITPPLHSRLEAECQDNRLLKTRRRSTKLTMIIGAV